MKTKGFTPSLKRALHSIRSSKIGVLVFGNGKLNNLDNNSSKNVELRSAPLVRGFTLLELIIVIGILAILGAVTVLVLNPAQLLAQARDTTRISDLSSIMSAIGYYLSGDITGGGAYVFVPGPRVTSGTACGFASGCPVASATDIYAVNNTGWVGIDFTALVGGSPIATLPRDPLNNANYNYSYIGVNSNKTFKLDARLESDKHKTKMTIDSGSKNTCSTYVESTCYYEVGTDLAL